MAEIRSPLGQIRGTLRRVSGGIFRPTPQQGGKGDSVSDNLNARNASLLAGIQKQINTLNKQQVIINKTLGVISTNLVASSRLEKQRIAAQKAREEKLVAQGLRDSKEASIEGAVQKALLAPVKAIQTRAMGIFARLTRFLSILAGGWLANKMLQLLEASAQGSVERIQEIKKNLLSGFIKAGLVLMLFNPLLGKITLAAAGIGFLIDNAAQGGALTKPFVWVINFLKKWVDKFNDFNENDWLGMNPINWFPDWNPLARDHVNNRGNDGGTPTKPFNFEVNNVDNQTNIETDNNDDIDKVITDEDQNNNQSNNTNNGKIDTNKLIPEKNQESWIDKWGLNPFKWFQGDNVDAAMMTPITDQDLLNEINFTKPEMGDFSGPGKTEEYEKALLEWNEKYAERIKELEARIAKSGNVDDKLITPNQKEDLQQKTNTLTSLISSLSEATPIIVPFPGDEESQSGASGTVTTAGGTGGSIPIIKSSNNDNSYVYIAYKHYQVTP
tara:strand:- start:670 stop:2166 length:1497 start_codon:yes stop_codon:yes gene_type:complete